MEVSFWGCLFPRVTGWKELVGGVSFAGCQLGNKPYRIWMFFFCRCCSFIKVNNLNKRTDGWTLYNIISTILYIAVDLKNCFGICCALSSCSVVIWLKSKKVDSFTNARDSAYLHGALTPHTNCICKTNLKLQVNETRRGPVRSGMKQELWLLQFTYRMILSCLRFLCSIQLLAHDICFHKFWAYNKQSLFSQCHC